MVPAVVGPLGALLTVLGTAAYRDRQARLCGNNLRQIALAMAVYPYDSSQDRPVFAASRSGVNVAVSDPAFDPVATTIASFELLAVVTGGDLTPGMFACPVRPTVYPTARATIPGGWNVPGPRRSSWAAGGPGTIGYAYDWSVPGNASSVRVILADRDTTAHHGVVVVACADGHVDTVPRRGGAFINRDAADDDIYSNVGDGPMDQPGGGSTTRAFVR